MFFRIDRFLKFIFLVLLIILIIFYHKMWSLKDLDKSEKKMQLEHIGHEVKSSFNTSTGLVKVITKCKRKAIPTYLRIRQRRIRSFCARLSNSFPPFWKMREQKVKMLKNLRWDRTHRIAYCHVPKVASTTWSWYLLNGFGIDPNIIKAQNNIHIMLSDVLPSPKGDLERRSKNYKHSVKFMISRHPYDRLVSAYENKIADPNPRRQQYRDLQNKLLDRRKELNWNITSLLPTFEEFVEYVLSEIELWHQYQNLDPPKNRFVDPHWLPIFFICSPCHINYDLYGKMETMDEDTSYIAKSCPHLTPIIGQNIKLNSVPDSGNTHIENPLENVKNNVNNNDNENNDANYDNNNNESSTTIKFSSLCNETSKNNCNPNKANDKSSKQYLDYIKKLPDELKKKIDKTYEFDFKLFQYSQSKD